MAALVTHPQRSCDDLRSVFSPVPALRRGFEFGPSVSSLMPESRVGGSCAVYVAVEKSVDKTVALLRWTISMFPGQEICLLHVHRPSLLIPTLCKPLIHAQIIVSFEVNNNWRSY